MSNRLSDKCLINVSLMFWFDSVGKIKTVNRIEPVVKSKNSLNTSKPNTVFAV